MKRSVRRHQQRVARARRVRILLRHGAWAPFSYWQPKIWQSLCRLVMSEPGWWVHERVIPSARTKTHRLEREVERDAIPIRWSGRTVGGRMTTIGNAAVVPGPLG
jgi:hypothetical protein